MQSVVELNTDQAIATAIALSHTRLSSGVLIRLVQNLGSVQAVWDASESALEPLMQSKSLNKFLAARRTIEPERVWHGYQAAKVTVIPFYDPAYPSDLKQSHDPPFVLFVRGNLQGLYPCALAVVGTRQYTEYGRKAVSALMEQLAPIRPCIVSGLAAGIDTLAHQTALQHQMPTVAVFGTGIDRIFPRETNVWRYKF
jgi:DNA processing protein